MIAIFKRELQSYFATPYGYVFLIAFLILAGITTFQSNILAQNVRFAETTVAALNFLLIPVVPLLTMKCFPDDRRQNTHLLLHASPVGILPIVVAKYLSALLLVVPAAGLTLIYPIIYSQFSRLDWIHIFGAYAGFFFLASSYIAVGIFISASTDNAAAAAVVTLLALLLTLFTDTLGAIYPRTPIAGSLFVGAIAAILLLWFFLSSRNLIVTVILTVLILLGTGSLFLLSPETFREIVVKVTVWMSLARRYAPFPQGLLKIENLVYYLSVDIFFLILAYLKIEKKRWS